MSTISASTTTTTAYKVTADTTGTLVLQTGSTPTTAATIDASQNVGVNSTGTIRTKLMVSSSNASDTLTVGTASGGFSITNTNNAYGLQFGSLSTGNSWIQSARLDGTATAYNLLLQLGGGNVGIGLTSPAYILDVGATGNSNTLNINGTASVLRFAGSSYGQIASTSTLYLDAGASQSVIFRPNGSTDAGRFDSSGNFLVGTTSVGTMSGSAVERLGNTGIISRTSNSLASGSAINIVVSSGGASFAGFLVVENVVLANALVRTQTTYSVFGRGTTFTATSIASANGSSGGASFTVTCPSTGVISVTNTSGNTTFANMSFFGSEGG